MDDLTSILLSVAGAIFILVALPAGLGIAMHLHTRFPRIAMPALAAALALVPPLGLILTGRNLSVKNLDFDTQMAAGGLTAWLFRLTSASVIAIAVTATLVYLLRRTKEDSAGRIVLVGFITYFVSNFVLNGLFGTVPALPTSPIYALLIMTALYVNRTNGLADVLSALRWGLFAMMALSLLWMVLNPQVVMQTNTPEVRLPFVNFRFWGLGDGPNSVAPMALTLLLLTLHQPFRFRLLTLASLGSGLAVLLLAQSMTTWIAALMVLPPYLVVRYLTHPIKGPSRRISGFAAVALVTLAGAVVLAAAALLLDLDEMQRTVSQFIGLARGQQNAALSGRAGIWAVAFRVFLENPLFGYGPTAWDLAFRSKINMLFAFHAHNQFFQAISVAGLIGLAGTIFYVAVLGVQSLRLLSYTRGLAPALFLMLLLRSVSEVPLELSSILTGTFLMHLTLFHVLVAGTWEMAHPPAAAPVPDPARTVDRPDWRAPPQPALVPALPRASGPASGQARPVLPAPFEPTPQAGQRGQPAALPDWRANRPAPANDAPAAGPAAAGTVREDAAPPSSDPPLPDRPVSSPAPAAGAAAPERGSKRPGDGNRPDGLGRVEPRLDL